MFGLSPVVLFPSHDPKPKADTKGISELALRNLLDILYEANGDTVQNKTTGDKPNINYLSLLYSPRAVPPESVAIPQQSTRHRYGPWFTQHNFIFGGEVESSVENDLVPENYIFPLYGSLPSPAGGYSLSFTEQLSGFVGMNYAAQAMANSIDGYGQFALEEGRITLPGAPVISRIGDALFTSGPRS